MVELKRVVQEALLPQGNSRCLKTVNLLPPTMVFPQRTTEKISLECC